MPSRPHPAVTTKAGPLGGPAFSVGEGRSANDLARLEAGGADVESLRRHTVHQRPHALDVGVPAALGAAVRVRDVVTEARPLAADVAVGSHGVLLKIDVDEVLSFRPLCGPTHAGGARH